MNMTKAQASGSAIVVGGGSGLGRATVLALAARGARVWAVGRDRARLQGVLAEAAAGPGEVITRAIDATDGAAMDRVIDEADPDLVVVSAGARARLALVHEQSWESFSEPWNTDVKIAFQIGQTALRRPLRDGSVVVIISSGAGLGGSPMSGGYAGAKRMQMFLAGYLQRSADLARRAIRFVTVVPKQIIPETELGAAAADAYAALAGMTRDKFMERFGAPLAPRDVAGAIVNVWQGTLEPPLREARVLGVSGAGLEAL
jgi:NAD(P)-dependent dehydrogenase (short-subunit alcohol dehydrogenase family)